MKAGLCSNSSMLNIIHTIINIKEVKIEFIPFFDFSDEVWKLEKEAKFHNTRNKVSCAMLSEIYIYHNELYLCL